jgi:uncharacterized protein YxjI
MSIRQALLKKSFDVDTYDEIKEFKEWVDLKMSNLPLIQKLQNDLVDWSTKTESIFINDNLKQLIYYFFVDSISGFSYEVYKTYLPQLDSLKEKHSKSTIEKTQKVKDVVNLISSHLKLFKKICIKLWALHKLSKAFHYNLRPKMYWLSSNYTIKKDSADIAYDTEGDPLTNGNKITFTLFPIFQIDLFRIRFCVLKEITDKIDIEKIKNQQQTDIENIKTQMNEILTTLKANTGNKFNEITELIKKDSFPGKKEKKN